MSFSQSLTPVVVDASVAMEWLSGTAALMDMFEAWLAEDRWLMAPAHFLLETANALLRGQGMPAAQVTMRIDQLIAADIDVADTDRRRLVEAIELSERHGLTVYDALYLQLAIDVDGVLATLDNSLQRAAAAEHVPLVS